MTLTARLVAAISVFRNPTLLKPPPEPSENEQTIRNLADGYEGSRLAENNERMVELEAELADANRKASGCETRLATTEAQLRKVIQQGVDPFIRDTLFQIKGVAITDIHGDDRLCFIGPNGCQTHPGWNLNGECGIAWVRSWLYDDDGKQTGADTRALLYVINDAQSPDGLPNDALGVLHDALLLWLKETPIPGTGGPDWGDREKRRLAEAMAKTLDS